MRDRRSLLKGEMLPSGPFSAGNRDTMLTSTSPSCHVRTTISMGVQRLLCRYTLRPCTLEVITLPRENGSAKRNDATCMGCEVAHQPSSSNLAP